MDFWDPACHVMAYSSKAETLRRCKALRRDGEPCRAWALWGDPRQLCAVHAGRHHRGPLPIGLAPRQPNRYVPCTCRAYNWPHRPGGGLCRWPDPPIRRLTTPAGTHGWLRLTKRN